MALRLNLHHEIDKKKALNRRDPLKLSMIGMAVVAAGFAGYYVLQLGAAHGLSSELAHVRGELDRIKGKAEAAKKREEELSTAVKLSEAMVKRVEKRFYWASVLDTVTQAVPREIQITKLSGDVANDKVRRCTITLEGISAGEEPRKVAEDLRRALSEKFATKYKAVNAKFTSLDDGKELVPLDGQQLPTAVFAINLHMQMTEEEAPPPPPPARRDRAAKTKESNLL